MSDSLDFDLNAPAASPTCRLHSRPRIPEADAKVEEAVLLPRYRGGYPAEPPKSRRWVQDFLLKKIDLTNSQMIFAVRRRQPEKS